MNNTAVIVLGMAHDVPVIEHADYIGADAGALFLAQKKIPMALALGDFDSVEKEDVNSIRNDAADLIQLNPIKNDSDSEAAADEAVQRGYTRVILWGGLGGRIDHEIVNLRLCMKYPGIVEVMDPRNRIRALKEGVYHFHKDEYKYFSVFAYDPAVVSESGFAYELDHRTMTSCDLYGLSNELREEEGIFTVHSGCVLLAESRD